MFSLYFSKMSIVEENTPTALSACSAADEMSWHEGWRKFTLCKNLHNLNKHSEKIIQSTVL